MIEKNDKKIDKKIDIGKQGEKVKEHLKVISTERRNFYEGKKEILCRED